MTMTDLELASLKMIQMNLEGKLDGLPRDILIFKLTNTKAVIDRLISAEEETRKSST
jgi:predicted AAA+ superfamily ATPase